jgi:hypothetical protein
MQGQTAYVTVIGVVEDVVQNNYRETPQSVVPGGGRVAGLDVVDARAS